MKPIIGIVGRSDISTEDYEVMCCFESVRRSIIKNNGIPILILPNQDVNYELNNPNDINKLTDIEKDELIRIVDLCDGIVIPGSYKLFEYDKFIYEYALNKNKSILCICGGMQLMGLVDNNINSKDVLKEINTNINHLQKNIKYAHKINIVYNTLLSKILNEKEILVNSKHKYCLNQVKNLKVSAISLDNVIEAVEVENKKFVLGIQWHPEVMIEYDECSNKIIDAFIKSC